jgi:hypothetical protein
MYIFQSPNDLFQASHMSADDISNMFIHYLWQSDSKFKKSNAFDKTAMNYAESNGLKKIVRTFHSWYTCGLIYLFSILWFLQADTSFWYR